MKNLLKRMVVGTFLEPLARKIHSYFVPIHGQRSASGVDEVNRAYDGQTIEVMKRVLKKDSNCVDVGCHEGSVLREILNLSPDGTHFAFEPLPEMYRALLDSFGGIPGVHINDCALSDVTGETSFQHVVTNPGYSGFRRRRYDRPDEQIQEIKVKTNVLDRIIPADAAIHFMKVDVEGAELLVFRGAMETIRKNMPVIVFEHGLGAADHYGSNPEAIYDLLAGQCGLRVFLMSDWLESNGRETLSREALCEHFYSGRNFYFMAAK